MAEVRHLHQWEPSINVKLKKLKEGGITWEIACTGATLDTVLAMIDEAHRRLGSRYGAEAKAS